MKNQIDLKTFVSKTVHELSNPLAILLGRLQLLSLESSSSEEVAMVKTLASMQKATQRIFDITRELKEVAILEDCRSPMSSHELAKFVILACDHIASKPEINFMLNLGEEITFLGDKKQLVRAIQNLISNAAEATESMSSRWIYLRIFKSHESLRIEVSDNGPKIETELAEKCFTPFFSTKKKTGASGMGLTLTQLIVNQHDGLVFVDPNMDQTTFVITLPLETCKAAA